MFETMPQIDQLKSIYWEMYKDAYGIRPRGINMDSWSEDQLNLAIDGLERTIEANEIQRKEDEFDAAVKFEERLTELGVLGAVDREMAIRWIHDAEGSQGDDDYLCFLSGLPYGYLNRVE